MISKDNEGLMNYRIIIVMMLVLCLGCTGGGKPIVSETVLDTAYHGFNEEEHDYEVNAIGDDKPGVFDAILDTYISFHGLNGKEHYIEVSANEEMKDHVLLSVEYLYVNVDELRLPDIYLEGEYQGVKVYCRFDSTRQLFPVDHTIALKRVNNTRKRYEWPSTTEYFNNITIFYDKIERKILSVSKGYPPDTLIINHFEGVFRARGIMD